MFHASLCTAYTARTHTLFTGVYIAEHHVLRGSTAGGLRSAEKTVCTFPYHITNSSFVSLLSSIAFDPRLLPFHYSGAGQRNGDHKAERPGLPAQSGERHSLWETVPPGECWRRVGSCSGACLAAAGEHPPHTHPLFNISFTLRR